MKHNINKEINKLYNIVISNDNIKTKIQKCKKIGKCINTIDGNTGNHKAMRIVSEMILYGKGDYKSLLAIEKNWKRKKYFYK